MNEENQFAQRMRPTDLNGDNARFVGPAIDLPSATGLKITPADIVYAIFRRKWMIGILTLLGLVAAGVFYKLQRPIYLSEAKLLIRYVQEDNGPIADLEEGRPKSVDQRGETILNTEIEILKSLDLAKQVVTVIGPERILGLQALEAGAAGAARAVQEGLDVQSATRSSVLQLNFSNPNAEIVQPVLNQVIESYLKRHVEVHRSSGKYNEPLVKEIDQLRARLANTEEELRKLKEQSGVLLLEDTKRLYTDQIAELQNLIRGAETELAERRAIVRAMTGSENTAPAADSGPEQASVPSDKRREYQQTLSLLDQLLRREQEYLREFTRESVAVTGVRSQINEAESALARLEAEHPALAAQVLPRASVGAQSPNGASAFDLATELAQIKALETRVEVLNAQLTDARTEAARINEIEPKLVELQRRKEMQEAQYREFTASLEKEHIKQALGGVSNISIIQAPSMPVRAVGRLLPITAGIAVSGLILGLALTLALDLFLDRSVRRPAEIERKFRIPLFLSVPQLAGKSRPLATALPPGAPSTRKPAAVPPEDEKLSPAPWTMNHSFRPFFEALRNRLVYSFEMRNLTHNPKLVALTSCHTGSGVSTIAAGLAATLSELGEGNVLLVNMHPDQQTPYYFRKGDLHHLALEDAFTQEKRSEAQVGENLYVVSSSSGKDMSQILPRRFNTMIPKFRASDYDYIIFDLPPVSQISVTPQLVRHMDQVLMVVEAEKTTRDAVEQANDMLVEAGARVGVVVNKTKSHVPAALALS